MEMLFLAIAALVITIAVIAIRAPEEFSKLLSFLQRTFRQFCTSLGRAMSAFAPGRPGWLDRCVGTFPDNRGKHDSHDSG